MEWLLVGAVALVVIVLIKVLQVSKKLKAAEALAAQALNGHLQSQKELLQSQAEFLQARQGSAKLIAELEARIGRLARYEGIADAEAKANEMLAEAQNALLQAKAQADQERRDANQAARAKAEQSEARLQSAAQEAGRIIETAKKRAEEIAGEAYAAMNRAKEFADTATAMKNVITGYGDSYIVPTHNLLDDLADEFGYTEAGKRLKEARETSRMMVKAGQAASCDYVEQSRKETAIRFAVDAFNGKVDSILSRSKADNHGKLEQEIRDAYALVNFNGAAFKHARISETYLAARLEELRWAATANALKDREREEQRQLREQLREEEKARREYERAIKEAAKEEESLRKSMARVQQLVAAATDAQRGEYEAKLRELEAKLQSAEERNQRALSMAQQTRAGHVYVISNVGSFGEEVFKIGMTRRLEPKDRIRELGDASVPFEFDVHALIFSDDAPSLEKTLHRHFLQQQVNKVNPRKEFFRVGLAQIRAELEQRGIEAHWTMAAAAAEYRETLRIEQELLQQPAAAEDWTRQQLAYEPEPEIEEAA